MEFTIIANAGFRDAHPKLEGEKHVYEVVFATEASLGDGFIVANNSSAAIASYLEDELGVQDLGIGQSAVKNISSHIIWNAQLSMSLGSRLSIGIEWF